MPAVFLWLVAAVRQSYAKQVLINDLLRLNDHQLADIGLRREQITPNGALFTEDEGPRFASRRSVSSALTRYPVMGCG